MGWCLWERDLCCRGSWGVEFVVVVVVVVIVFLGFFFPGFTMVRREF